MTTNDPKLQKVLERAKKLMAFNSENATENEVAIATVELHKLLRAHQLSIADVEAGNIGEGIVRGETDRMGRPASWNYVLVECLATPHQCRVLLNRVFDHSKRRGCAYRFSIIGFASDVEVVHYLYDTLSRTLSEMSEVALRHCRKNDNYISSPQRFKNAFISAAAYVVRERLTAVDAEMQSESSACTALAVSKDKAVDGALFQLNAKEHRTSMVDPLYDRLGAALGSAAGWDVPLNKCINAGSSASKPAITE